MNAEDLGESKGLKDGEGFVIGSAEITDAARRFMRDIISSDS